MNDSNDVIKMSQMDKYIFDNLNYLVLSNITIKNNKQYKIVNKFDIHGLSMDHEFNEQIILPPNLIRLTMGYSFNKSIILPANLTDLTMGHSFDKRIKFPANLTQLTMGFNFKYPIILPTNLTHLTMGHSFDHPLILPTTLTHLTMEFGDCYYSSITIPPNVIDLQIMCDLYHPIILPHKLKFLHITSYNCDKIRFSNNIDRHLVIYINDSMAIQRILCLMKDSNIKLKCKYIRFICHEALYGVHYNENDDTYETYSNYFVARKFEKQYFCCVEQSTKQ